jgi:cytochrome b
MATVRVWDPFVRLVHWSVAVLIVIDLLNDAGANPWHRYLGYAAGALVLLRLAWGLNASRHARLSAMTESARTLRRYIAGLRAGKHRFYAGHNPLGACMAFTLWALLLVMVLTGWMLRLDAFWGDELLQTAHTSAAYVLAALAIVHVSGAVVTSAMTRTNLVKAMITGEKTFRDPPA